ncbi:Peptidyl-prolyl cis-trans isomerase CWC27 like protein [Eufriesea mexicana]|uniref:Spliceosome-associated protein CWC27 homolog n=1 Tax=Eufriesea mexicana TaxID=516756 RepID=A0A310S5A3_9HYME|nr:Peptidyl-prolyl cis-trans isomerase CWC27 like protein [Eufriesea mexicana]
MGIIEEMENEHLVIVVKVKDILNIECKCFIKTKMCINFYKNLASLKAIVVMGLFIEPMSKWGKRRLADMGNTYLQEPSTMGKDDFCTRLRSCARGLIAMANDGEDDNGSQFFFTHGSTLELQNKHTIFNDGLLYSPNMINTEILNNPFSDIISRIIVEESEEVKDSSKAKIPAVKDFNVLSFGEEAEEDEEESVILNKKFSDQGKSARDHLTNSKLSS